MFKYLKAPDELGCDYEKYPRRVFLAGGVTTKEHWQEEVAEKLRDLDILLINPRRNNYPDFKEHAGWIEAKKQIHWEYFWRSVATQVVFWFSEETLQPISLLELGNQLEVYLRKNYTSDALFIGAHPNYQRRFDLVNHVPLLNPKIQREDITDSLDGLVLQIRNWNTLLTKEGL